MQRNVWGFLAAAISCFLPNLVCADNHYYSNRIPPSLYPSPLNQREKTLLDPPGNGFGFEVHKLVESSTEKYVSVEGMEWFVKQGATSKNDIARQEFESKQLLPQQLETLSAAKYAVNFDTAYSLGESLPPIVRTYTTGAVAFKDATAKAAPPVIQTYATGSVASPTNDLQEAAKRFSEVAAADGSPYKIMATYMLGRTYAKLGQTDKARGLFSATRDLVSKGAPDPMGLAAASYGEEARIALDEAGGVLGEEKFNPSQPNRLAKFHEAIRLYVLQLQTGSQSGLDSLHILAKNIKNVPSDFKLLMQDELARRLFLAYVRGYGGSLQGVPHRKEFVAASLPLFPMEDQAIADQLAASAYEIGNLDLANHYVLQKQSAYSTWVKAKLALHGDDQEKAAALYQEAFEQKQQETSNPSIDPNNEQLTNERAILTLARGQYVKSFEEMYPLTSNYNSSYLAARILTIDELRNFVDANVPESATIQPKESSGISQNELFKKTNDAFRAQVLRNVLAQRLMRLGKYHDALIYIPDWGRKVAVPYVKELDAANSAIDPIDKAEALFHAAKIELEPGETLYGQELIDTASPDDDLANNPFMTSGERERLAATRSESPLPHSFRKIAANMASQAADLVPPKSQAFAAILCHATGWVRPAAEELSDQYYKRYVKQGTVVPWATHFGHHCQEPNFFIAKHFRLAHAFFWTRREVVRHWRALGVVLAVLSGMTLILGIYRHYGRRQSAKT